MEFRFAERKDVPLILYFIKELADYEKMLDEVVATEELLEQWLFEKNKAEVIFSMEDGVETCFLCRSPLTREAGCAHCGTTWDEYLQITAPLRSE